jgi:hypothetical protein
MRTCPLWQLQETPICLRIYHPTSMLETGETPRDYMLRVMRDEKSTTPRRDAMAKPVAPYCHPQLASVAVKDETRPEMTEEDHPLQGDEIRALRRLQREQGLSSHVFMTERAGPMTPKAFHALFGRIGERAKMPFPIHPHMLRHPAAMP